MKLRSLAHARFLLAAAGLAIAAACTEPSAPLAGRWTGRVLLTAPTGVPTVDSAARATIVLALTHHGETVSGTATGLFGVTSSVSGTFISDSVHLVFAFPGIAGAGASFAGTLENGTLPGHLRAVLSQVVQVQPMRFTHE